MTIQGGKVSKRRSTAPKNRARKSAHRKVRSGLTVRRLKLSWHMLAGVRNGRQHAFHSDVAPKGGSGLDFSRLPLRTRTHPAHS
jgi:hypothetical protein